MVATPAQSKKQSPGAGLETLKARLLSAPQAPVLGHLNADTSWILSLPYPPSATRPRGRTRFNVLIDPWFTGAQSDVASWFSTQYHAIPSSIQNCSVLNAALAEAETESDRSILTQSSTPSSAEADISARSSYIDMVAISHEFTDHCHRATLEELLPSTPIFTTTKAAQLIRSWSHFHTVIDVPSLTATTDWRTTSISPLPAWLGISRLITEGNSLYYHSALVFCFSKPDKDDHTAKAVIYTPHGVESATFAQLASAQPPIETLAFLHGLHDVSITLSKQLNLGAHNAFKAQKLLKPKYWVGTHDEVKRGLGLIGPLLRRKAWTIDDAIKKAGASSKASGNVKGDSGEEKVPYVDLGNGEILVLE